jgi:hypothetical protein
MGGGSWSPSHYTSYATNKGLIDKAGKATNISANEIYTSRKVNQALDPKGVKVRESRDSAEHPEATPIIIGLDVTGSMANVLRVMAQKGLPTLMKEIYNRTPVPDPQIMFMGIGDVECDSGPLQVSQFESDIRIAEQLELLWLEQGGGGNYHESYTLPWYFANNHIVTDCAEKRGQKGFIFTIGDEEPNPYLRMTDLQRVLGYKPQADYTAKQLRDEVEKKWEIYHLMVEEGNHFRGYRSETINAWTELLGDNAILLADHTKLAETIVSAIQIREGMDPEDVIKSWEDKHTAEVVAKATKTITKRVLEL